MQSGANKIKFYVKTFTGKTETLYASPEDSWLSVKKQVVTLLGACPEKYEEFEYYTRGMGLEDTIKLVFAGKEVDYEKTLDSSTFTDGSTISIALPFGNHDYSIRITCIANNIKFTTFIKYDKNNPCTISQLKAQLSEYTSLTCTTLCLKRKGMDEYPPLQNDTEKLPLKDIYAILDGNMAIEPRGSNLHLYSAEDGKIVAGVNSGEAREDDYNYDHDTRMFFSTPKSDSIVALSSEQRKSLINCVSAVNPPPSNTQSISNPAHKIWVVLGALSGAGSTSLSQCLALILSSTMRRGPYSEVAYFTALGAVVGAAIGGISSFVYERYFKSQDITPTQFNANYR